MRLLAIDQSLTNSGIAYTIGGDIELTNFCPKNKGVQRLIDIREYLKDLILRNNINIVIQEEYAFSGHGHTFSLGELGGLIKVLCYDLGVISTSIPIQTHKMYTTGKGNTKKDLMMKEVYRLWNIDVTNDNIADAVSILQTFLGLTRWLKGDQKFTTSQIRAMNKLLDIVKENSVLFDKIRSFNKEVSDGKTK